MILILFWFDLVRWELWLFGEFSLLEIGRCALFNEFVSPYCFLQNRIYNLLLLYIILFLCFVFWFMFWPFFHGFLFSGFNWWMRWRWWRRKWRWYVSGLRCFKMMKMFNKMKNLWIIWVFIIFLIFSPKNVNILTGVGWKTEVAKNWFVEDFFCLFFWLRTTIAISEFVEDQNCS